MLNFISYVVIFALGIIAAVTDWRYMTGQLFSFDEKVQGFQEVIDPVTGLPTGETQMVMVENQFKRRHFLMVIFSLVVAYFVLIIYPAKILLEHMEGKCTS